MLTTDSSFPAWGRKPPPRDSFYDGAPDTLPPSSIGYGATAKAAIRDLLEIMLDECEITEAEHRNLLALHCIG